MYSITLSGPTEDSRSRQHLILGLPADAFFRIAAPLTMGALSAVGLIYAARGNNTVATTLALTGLVMSSLVATGQAIALEEERRRL